MRRAEGGNPERRAKRDAAKQINDIVSHGVDDGDMQSDIKGVEKNKDRMKCYQ